MKKRLFAILFVVFLLITVLPLGALGAYNMSDSAKQFSYSNLHDSIFFYPDPFEDSNITGLNFTTGQITSNINDIDLVINRYKAMAATGIATLGDVSLTEPVDTSKQSYKSEVNAVQGNTYLIVTHDGSFAKIHIDLLLENKVTLSYMMVNNTPIPTPVPPVPVPSKVFDLGNKTIEDTYKQWTIKFNNQISAQDFMTNKWVKMTDTYTNSPVSFQIQLGDDKTSLVIQPPSLGYQPEHSYLITIDQSAKAVNGKLLAGQYIFKFNVENSIPKPQDDVSDLSYLFHTWKMSIPGAVDWNTGTAKPGLTLEDALTIYSDGTYEWNSSWEGELIKGTWERGDSEYPITLLKAEDGHNWKVGLWPSGGGDLLAWDPEASIWKNGDLIQ